jgi:hypothetical protein
VNENFSLMLMCVVLVASLAFLVEQLAKYR